MSIPKFFPTFEEIENNSPRYSAWGIWENPQLGALNYLSDSVVLKTATQEIQTGIRVGLNLPLDFVDPPLLGRRGFERHIINKAPRVINDDVITFNTQGSSQWDSFRHFAYQDEAKFYNNVTQSDIHDDPNSGVNGMEAWSASGIAGRGVLIDYYSWAGQKGIHYDPLKTHAIRLSEIKEIIKESNIELHKGDIFMLRTGFVDAYSTLDKSTRERYSSSHAFPGLEQSREVVKWLWEQQFAAVAADSPAFECVRTLKLNQFYVLKNNRRQTLTKAVY
ncbi:uncharacterized protein Z519_11251 [Cladophialophora bantiana CBS 173.52]|uniref:Cyclase n=1 Tax=Cladophialophora bantiana (strain ATCC 10958 / CBS 173.52 / CDC B-1940 / NIH 8579) TaxID=1442370 RepID=A0A0D2HB57_CLAB1|nr:uncharacterized protein Z519_11251 [Cladophialophora bantiana CBS 173.52]KIW88140.1 hypothetical protein Z519_11251 [Cladophialophora bantiana CBS 173.52]